jgi:hypothetical protein
VWRRRRRVRLGYPTDPGRCGLLDTRYLESFTCIPLQKSFETCVSVKSSFAPVSHPPKLICPLRHSVSSLLAFHYLGDLTCGTRQRKCPSCPLSHCEWVPPIIIFNVFIFPFFLLPRRRRFTSRTKPRRHSSAWTTPPSSFFDEAETPLPSRRPRPHPRISAARRGGPARAPSTTALAAACLTYVLQLEFVRTLVDTETKELDLAMAEVNPVAAVLDRSRSSISRQWRSI